MKKIVIICFLILSFSINLEAAYVFSNGRLTHADRVAVMDDEGHYYKGITAMESRKWKEAAKHFNIVTIYYPNSPLASKSYYYLGVCYFNYEEYDFANDALNCYLNSSDNVEFYTNAVEYKFCIAEAFRCGAKRRLLKTTHCPKWASGCSVAASVYDEVIMALPNSELAARSLYAKGCILLSDREYKESVDSFYTLIRRFPKNEFAPLSYVMITKIYLKQSEIEFQNPDLLALAEIALRNFQRDFPRDERLEEASCNVIAIKEIYAKGLYETGRFYEKTYHPHAAVIYYNKVLKDYPDTYVADCCQERLDLICPNFMEQTEL